MSELEERFERLSKDYDALDRVNQALLSTGGSVLDIEAITAERDSLRAQLKTVTIERDLHLLTIQQTEEAEDLTIEERERLTAECETFKALYRRKCETLRRLATRLRVLGWSGQQETIARELESAAVARQELETLKQEKLEMAEQLALVCEANENYALLESNYVAIKNELSNLKLTCAERGQEIGRLNDLLSKRK